MAFMDMPHVPKKPPAVDRMLVRAFRHLVEEALGLHFSKEQEQTFIHGLFKTQVALGHSDLPTLFERLEEEGPKGPGWQRLGLELTTGESYFFRDRGQIALIRDVLLEELKGRSRPREVLRLWSAGCSRGEEAYTLAILAEEALPTGHGFQVQVLGTDINPLALEQAGQGWYSPWSLRGLEASLLSRWFLPDGEGFRVVPTLRERVIFREHNLARDPMGPLSEGEGFDLILCRNVFIYFHARRVRDVLQGFRAALKPQGALILGHGEWGMERPEGLSLEPHPHSMVMRPDGFPRETPPPAQTRLLSAPSSKAETHRASLPRPSAEPPPRSLDTRLREMRTLADRGKLEEALQIGEQILHDHPLSAEAHHLCALLLAERGDAEGSLSMLDKALYLDPRHLGAHLDRARHFESLGAFSRAAQSWNNAQALLTSHPSGAEELMKEDREELQAFLEKALRRCAIQGTRRKHP